MKVVFKEDLTGSGIWDRAGGCGRAWKLWLQFKCKRMKAWTPVLAVRTDWKRKAWRNFDT